jgi:hypothetical protein
MMKGNLSSMYLYPNDLMAGAASGIYGLFSLQIIYIVEYYLYLNEARQHSVGSFMWVIGSTFMLYFLGNLSNQDFR